MESCGMLQVNTLSWWFLRRFGSSHCRDDELLQTTNVNPFYMPVEMKVGRNCTLGPGAVLVSHVLERFSKSRLEVKMPVWVEFIWKVCHAVGVFFV